MNKTPIPGNSSANNSKRILRDLLVIATVFVTLVALGPTALAQTTHYYAAVYTNHGQALYRAVNGTQDTKDQGSVSVGTGSFVGLGRSASDFFSVGVSEGL